MDKPMDAWQIVLLVVVVLVVLALLAWAATRRQRTAKREAQAREHLTEARERQARAESARAAADEKAAQLRRERAELEQRMAQQERESAELAADADRDQARAAELQQRARKLAPQLSDDAAATGAGVTAGTAADRDGDGLADRTVRDTGTQAGTYDPAYRDRDGLADGTVRDTDTGTGTGTDVGTYADRTDRDRDGDGYTDGTVDDRPPATTYRHTAPVTDPESTTGPVDDSGAHRLGDGDEGAGARETVVDRQTVVDRDGDGYADETVQQTYVDRDGDGVADDEERGGGLRRLKDRLTGRVDDGDQTVEDRDVPGAPRRRP
jgi:F0F1-type ATP synthase membrane subunit b/b'